MKKIAILLQLVFTIFWYVVIVVLGFQSELFDPELYWVLTHFTFWQGYLYYAMITIPALVAGAVCNVVVLAGFVVILDAFSGAK